MIDKKIKFEIEIKLIKGHQKIVDPFYENSITHLIRKCNVKAKRIRETINKRIMTTNIKFLGSYSMIVSGILVRNSVQEVVRIIDTKKVK